MVVWRVRSSWLSVLGDDTAGRRDASGICSCQEVSPGHGAGLMLPCKASTSVGIPACTVCGWRPSPDYLEHCACMALNVVRPKALGLMVRCPECDRPIYQILIAGEHFPFPTEAIEGCAVFVEAHIEQVARRIFYNMAQDSDITWHELGANTRNEYRRMAEQMLIRKFYDDRIAARRAS